LLLGINFYSRLFTRELAWLFFIFSSHVLMCLQGKSSCLDQSHLLFTKLLLNHASQFLLCFQRKKSNGDWT
jgi:hypothetical protein